jgi:serine/threonine-protein kinase
MIGSTLAHYEILEKLGEGGMGTVWRARDTRLNRLVAIKLLRAERVADPGRKQRFIQEAQAASALNHPSIVTIYDIDHQNGLDYMVMEYVSGKTLADLIPKSGMGLSDALKVAVQISDALTKAHAAGIIHRDLKPDNIFLTRDGLVKILDFGLAKGIETQPGAEPETTRTIAITDAGTTIGTVAYMSPEQARGNTDLGAQSDQFSFGLVLYELAAGKRAFQRGSAAETMTAIIREDFEPLPEATPAPLRWVP